MRQRQVLIAFLVIFAVSTITACSTFSGKTSRAKSTIKIGAILPLSGEGTPDQGLASQKGIELAVEELNAAEGFNGAKFEVVIEDSQCEVSKGVTAVQRLINIEKVEFIIGDICDAVTAAVIPIAQKAGVVLVTPGSTSPGISEAGDHIFRFWFSEDDMGRRVAEDATRNEVKKLAIIYINNPWGIAQQAAVAKHFEEQGGTVVSKQAVEPDTTDYRTLLLKAEAEQPDAFYVGTFPNGLELFMEQQKSHGEEQTVYAHGGLTGSTLAIAPDDTNLDGIRSPFVQDPDPEFARRFEKRFKEAPGITADSSYDIVKAASFVMKDEATFSGDILAEKLASLKNYKGASGTIDVDENGDTQRTLSMFTTQNGKMIVSED